MMTDKDDDLVDITESSEVGDDYGHSLPEMPVSRLEEKTDTQSQRSICKWVGLLTIFLLGVILGTALPLTLNDDDSSNTQKNSSPMTPKLPDVVHFDFSRYSEVAKFLTDNKITTSEHLANFSSYQYLAANWLANQDELDLPLPEGIFDEWVYNDAYIFVVRYVLAAFYYSTGGRNWLEKANFKNASDVCTWGMETFMGETIGVKCDERLRVPEQLKFEFNNLSHNIPSELALLWTLKVIDLEGNQLTGTIPSEFGSTLQLQALNVGRNNITGSIPETLGSNYVLRSLVVSNNQMTGTVPSSLKKSPVSVLALDDNDFEGDITVALSGMSNLTLVILEDNRFTGTINDDFLNPMPDNLEYLDMSDNLLTGSIPAHLFESSTLSIVDLHGNKLSSKLPAMPLNEVMTFLALHENELTGTVPSTIGNLVALNHLDLSQNQFTGSMPRLPAVLNYVFLAANNFTRGPIPYEYINLSYLREISLKSTSRTGTIPTYFSTFEDLVVLDLDDNDLDGTIPSSLGSLSKLQALLLNRNDLTGTVPSELASLSSLRLLFLERNSVSGSLEGVCSQDRNEEYWIIADCPQVTCPCCTTCCQDTETSCNDNTWIPSTDPTWESLYKRSHYSFGKNATFRRA